MSGIVIVILIYRRHKPIDLITFLIEIVPSAVLLAINRECTDQD
jgi:hypothetical protein